MKYDMSFCPLFIQVNVYNPPSYSIGRHVFLSGILSVRSGGRVNLLTLVTMNIICINSRYWLIQIFLIYGCALENNVFTASFGIAYTTCHFQRIKLDSFR